MEIIHGDDDVRELNKQQLNVLRNNSRLIVPKYLM